MPDQPNDVNPAAYQLFEGSAFPGLERALRALRLNRLSERHKIAFAILATWVPMLILAAVQGCAIGPTRAESFLLDPAMYARYLVALPLLLYSQKKISDRLRSTLEHFLNAKLVKETEQERFLGNIAATMRLRYSSLMDWMFLALACAHSAVLFQLFHRQYSATWRLLGPGELSLAGWWLTAISEVFFSFVMLRFIYRIGLWWRILFQTSQLELQLDAAHPDAAGGLGFLGLTLHSFKEAAFALSASFAAGLANIVLLTGERVTSYKYGILAVVVVNIGLFCGPLGFFRGLLLKVRLRGTLEYWALWQRQRRQFDRKWMRAAPECTDLLSVADFSEATDLSQILERVQLVKLLPFRHKQLLPLIVAALSPFVLVATLEFPVEEIAKQLLKMAFK